MKLSSIPFISNKLAFWIALFVTGIIFFAFFRLLFLLTHLLLVEGIGLSTIFYPFWLGLRYDTNILSIIILPLLLISAIPFIKFSSRIVQRIYSIILTIVFAFLFILLTADIDYYDTFGSRLDYWAIAYLKYPMQFLYSAVTAPHFWIAIIIWAMITILFYWLVKNIFRRLEKFPSQNKLIWHITGYLIALALLALSIRGSLGVKPLDWGTAFFSDNQFINQLSLNGPYTLVHSIYEERETESSYADENQTNISKDELADKYRTVRRMLNLPIDTASAELTLRHTDATTDTLGLKPNIVVIIMESWTADILGALGSKLGITPYFDRLASEGILFSNFYANGVRTNRGIPAILCSFPSPSGRTIMQRFSADYPFRSLADILKEQNYHNVFAYGGDIQFDNMAGFLHRVGYNQFYDESNFNRSDRLGKWGIADHIVLERLAEDIKSYPRPFHLAVMTLSNHDPYLIPDARFKKYDDTVPNSNRLNTLFYTDWAIGQFIDSIKTLPIFDSTIFVITSDHCPHQGGKYPLAPRNFHIPLLIYAPALIGDSAVRIDKTGSQVDIIPTLLPLTGISAEQFSWGRDLLHLRADDSGFAVIVAEGRYGLIEPPYFYFDYTARGQLLYDMRQRNFLDSNIITAEPDISARMKPRLDSYLTLVEYLSRRIKK
jgi:phosphoglycerol transferase MdoB-like AlkP superfamily enzyme